MKCYKKRNDTLFLTLISCLAGLVVMAMTLPGFTNAESNNTISTSTTLSPKQLAAGGPLPGKVSQVEEEQECITAEHSETTNIPWYPTMVNTEHGGSERAGVFDCAHFGGSFTEPNQVYAFQSPASLGVIRFLCNPLFWNGAMV
jgi:hypothetical protein